MRYCYYCGASMNEGAKFCPACGADAGQRQAHVNAPVKAPVNANAQLMQQSKPEKKAHQAPLWLVFVIGGLLVAVVALAAALYALGLVSVGDGKKTEGKGYDSPEAAMEAYAEAFEKRDVQGVLSTFAIESVAEHYDFAELLKRNKAFAPGMYIYCSDNPYGEELTAEALRGHIASDLLQQYTNLIGYKNDIELWDGIPRILDTDKDAEAFADYFNDSKLFQSVEFIRVVEPDEVFRAAGMDNMLEDPSTQKNMQRVVDILGAQAINEGCLEFEIDGEKYWVFLRQVQYDGKWYNVGFHGMMPSILGIDVQVNLVDVKTIPEY